MDLVCSIFGRAATFKDTRVFPVQINAMEGVGLHEADDRPDEDGATGRALGHGRKGGAAHRPSANSDRHLERRIIMISPCRSRPLLRLVSLVWRHGLDAVVIADESESVVQVREKRQGYVHIVQISATNSLVTSPTLEVADNAVGVGVSKTGGLVAAPGRPLLASALRPCSEGRTAWAGSCSPADSLRRRNQTWFHRNLAVSNRDAADMTGVPEAHVLGWLSARRATLNAATFSRSLPPHSGSASQVP
jgi:hypothetical protein